MSDVVVLAYFPDDLTRVYQLAQWLPVLEVLDDDLRVGLVTRDPAVAESCRRLTRLPVHLAPSFAELMALYGELDAKLVLYCNNSPRNFESWSTRGCCTCTSTTARATSRAWPATTPRPTTGCSSPALPPSSGTGPASWSSTPPDSSASDAPSSTCTPSRCSPPSERRTVLYAPTWEGDADYNSYTSVDVYGRAIVGSILALPRVRLVYKPHPKVTTSDRPDITDSPRSASTGSTCRRTSPSCSPTGTTTRTACGRTCR